VEIRELRTWVHGYQCKLGRDKNPLPPDDTILSQLLALAPLYRIVRMIEDLTAERKEPGYSYGWYVTLAMQRIHGIRADEFKARKGELRLEPKRHKGLTGEQQELPVLEAPKDQTPPEKSEQPDPDFGRNLIAEVSSKRAAKGHK
jgi:hypothetical protein